MTSIFDPGSRPVEAVDGGPIDGDIVIIGSGLGGGTLAHAIRDSGARVLVTWNAEPGMPRGADRA
jgi:NADPH-dependent 2,4-dienoyl-CoA reductase/sulfur reductase-like enzyme